MKSHLRTAITECKWQTSTRKRNCHSLLPAMQINTAIMENTEEVFKKKLKVDLSCGPAIWLLEYSKVMKPTCHQRYCIPMFNSALFTIANIWNWPENDGSQGERRRRMMPLPRDLENGMCWLHFFYKQRFSDLRAGLWISYLDCCTATPGAS